MGCGYCACLHVSGYVCACMRARARVHVRACFWGMCMYDRVCMYVCVCVCVWVCVFLVVCDMTNLGVGRNCGLCRRACFGTAFCLGGNCGKCTCAITCRICFLSDGKLAN
jgi:hypothetical protein